MPDAGEIVPWRYVRTRTGEQEEVVQLPTVLFRAALARVAMFAGIDRYCGQAIFGVEPAANWAIAAIHRFSLFICNEPQMGFWIRLYLYRIDGSQPLTGGRSNRTAKLH